MNYALYYKNSYYVGISFEVLSYSTLYKYSVIVYYDLISLPCINLMSYLCIVFIKLFVFYRHDSFFYCPCYFNDMFYIHVVGSMEHWMNEGMNLYQNFCGRDLSHGSNIRNMWISILIYRDFKQLFYYFCCKTVLEQAK